MYIDGLITIVIPAFNCRNYIVETVNSALQQTYTKVEVIVINDGSTDDTEEVLRNAGLIKQVRYFVQTNQGLSASRNFGLGKSQGEYLCFLDSDDLLSEDFCSEMILFMKETSSNFAYSNYHYFADTVTRNRINIKLPKYEGAVFSLIVLGNFLPVCSVVVKRSTIGELTFDTSLRSNEDWWFWTQIAFTNRLFFNRNTEVLIRKRSGSMMTKLWTMYESYAIVVEYIHLFLRSHIDEIHEVVAYNFNYVQARRLIRYGRYKDAKTRWNAMNTLRYKLLPNASLAIWWAVEYSRFFPLIRWAIVQMRSI